MLKRQLCNECGYLRVGGTTALALWRHRGLAPTGTDGRRGAGSDRALRCERCWVKRRTLAAVAPTVTNLAMRDENERTRTTSMSEHRKAAYGGPGRGKLTRRTHDGQRPCNDRQSTVHPPLHFVTADALKPAERRTFSLKCSPQLRP